MHDATPTPTPSLWQRTVSAVAGTFLLVGATLLMLGALLLGLLLATGVVGWSLLRGRRPGPVNIRWGRMPGARGFGRPPTGEVVDVQARDVSDPKLR